MEPEFGSKGVLVMQSLMKGKYFFKAQQIYIYIWKADKGVAEIKFCYPKFACEEKR